MENTLKKFSALLLIFTIFMTNSIVSFAQTETINVELCGETPKEQALNNMVYVYDLNSVMSTLTSSTKSVASCLKGIYTTDISGDAVIRDIEVSGDYMYLATPEGIEVVSFAEAKQTGITQDTAVNLSKITTIAEENYGGVMDLELSGHLLYGAYSGPEVYGAPNETSANGSLAVYDLTNPAEPTLSASQTVKYGIADALLNKTENKIYMLNDTASTASMTAFGYTETEEGVTFGEEITENIPQILDTKIGESPTKVNAGHIILENEKYIFVAQGIAPQFVRNGAVKIYDKKSGELLKTLSKISSSKYWYLPIRDMQLVDDVLYVSWGHCISFSEGSIDQALRETGYTQSPTVAYDVSDVTPDADIPSLMIDSGNAYGRSHDPYTWGGISFSDEINGRVFTSKVSNISENRRKYIGFKTADVPGAIESGTKSAVNTIAFHTSGLSMNAVQFIIKDGWLFEVLQQNAGLTGVTASKSLKDESKNASMVVTSDKYIFAATDPSGAKKAYTVSIFDKETYAFLTRITHSSPTTVFLRINQMHVIGDYLYVVYTQRNGGNPCICKYDIKNIYEGMKIEPYDYVGIRPEGYSYIDDNVICRVDSGYGNITFMRTQSLSSMSAIGVASSNAALLKSYLGMHLADERLFAYTTNTFYVYDASYSLKGISRQDGEVFKGSIQMPGTIKMIRDYSGYLYVSASNGLYIVDTSDDALAEGISIVGQIEGISAPDSIDINNGYLYVSDGGSLKIYSLESATAPSLIYTMEQQGGAFNYIHLRPGKLFAATDEGIEIYNVSGLEIEENTQAGTEDIKGDILYKQALETEESVSSISAGGKCLFMLNDEKNNIDVIDGFSFDKIAEIYKESGDKKLTISDMYAEGEYFFVSYDSVLRKYKIADLENGIVNEEQVQYLYTADMTKNSANHIVRSDKYIFVASGVTSKYFLCDSKVLVFDKATKEYLTSFWLDTGGNSDLAVRNMYVSGEKLYVSYNNAKTSKSYSNAISGNVNSRRYHAPLYCYDISNITKGGQVTKALVTSNAELANLSHPYNRGGNSYLDEENGLLYQGTYVSGSQSYKVYDVSDNSYSLVRTLTGGNSDCVSFFVKDGFLYEILDNNGGLSVSTVVTQPYNKVVIYDITDNTATDLKTCLKETYQTSVYGTSTVSSVETKGNTLYLGTKDGIEIVSKESYEKISLVPEVGAVNRLEIIDNMLFVASATGLYIYDISGNISLLASYLSAVNDFDVDEVAKKIYITASRAGSFGKVLSYDLENKTITDDSNLILEDINSYNVKMSESYILAFTGETKEQANAISVYPKSSGIISFNITKEASAPLDITAFSNLFCTFDANVLSFYKIPSAAAALSDCLVATYELDGNIKDVIADGSVLYVGTDIGVVALDVSAAGSGTVKKLVDFASGNVSALAIKNDFIYVAFSDADKLILLEKATYTELAAVEIENEKVITEITPIEENVFCKTESGEVLVYYLNDGIVITYDVDIKEPVKKEVYDIKYERGFPYVDYETTTFTGGSLVEVNDDYIVTAGAADIKVFDKKLNELTSFDVTNVSDINLRGNKLLVASGSSPVEINTYSLEDLSEVSVTPITSVTAKSVMYATDDTVWIANRSTLGLLAYSFDGELLATISGCPSGITEVYYYEDYLYLAVSDKLYIYDVAGLEKGAAVSATDIYKTELTTYKNKVIACMEATEDDYLYIGTSDGNPGNNRLLSYSLQDLKAGTSDSVTKCGEYESVSLFERGGKISDMVRRGDYIIIDAVDANEIQVVNIQERTRPYRESIIRKGVEDNFAFVDIEENGGKVYAISQTGELCIYKYTSVDMKNVTFISDGRETLAPMGNKIAAKVSIYNESGRTIDGKLLLALYKDDSAKRLDSVVMANVYAENGKETMVVTDEIKIDSYSDYKAKVILVDDLKSLSPMCEETQNLVPITDEQTIYVDASRAPGGDGTIENPFNNIKDAKDKVREINKSMSANITVEIAGGRYELSEPLVFDDEDSGFNGYKVIYKAKNGEKPIISGGKKVEGWTLYDAEKGIYSAPSGGIETRQLFVDGERAVRARSKGRLTNATCDEGELGIYCYDDFLCDFKHIQDLELVFINSFKSKRAGVDGAYKLDSAGKTLLTVNRPFWYAPSGTSSYVQPTYYENALELLDEENEFYLDVHDDVFYYKPVDGTDITTAEIIAPTAEELLVFRGKSLSNRIKNIEFSGFEFSATTWMLPTENGGFYPTQAGYWSSPNNGLRAIKGSPVKSALTFERAENITIDSCVIKNIGATGIGMISAVKDVNISNNHIYDISACGVQIGETDDGDANPFDERKWIERVYVDNNYIHDAACEYQAFCAVTIGTVRDVNVTHNEIYNTPYSAVHLGWGWDALPKRNMTNVKVEYNHIHDVVKMMGDGGAVYATGMTLADPAVNANSISYNYIEKIMMKSLYAGSAIYLDTGTIGYAVRGNVVNLKDNTTLWIPKWSTGRAGNIFDGNFTTTVLGYSGATNTTVCEDGNFPEEAIAIRENAGVVE